MDGDRGIGLVREDVNVIVPVSDEQVVLQGSVCDRDLDDVGRAGELLDGDRAGPEPRLDLGVLSIVAVVFDTLRITSIRSRSLHRAGPGLLGSACINAHLVLHGGDVSIRLADLDNKVRPGVDGPIGSLVSVAKGRESGRGKE